ncbi:hypothetical protein [Mangrovicoccus algicola]|uniref:Uncharacterized protein n=1 Tax=Mangrovicoccus algicola TaxID=2771008 RepID=A0A8J6YSQ0_9RHOB|nr:hypothetical protein [Mangrovicoccus algicola]MBE3636682.1 hypothetical protein [Mangrovicoccus algicola]
MLIYWHLGFQKTGTTSFQTLLARNSERLEPFLGVFPKGKTTRRLRHACNRYWSGKDRGQAEADMATAVDQMIGEARGRGQSRMLVSDENLIGFRLSPKTGNLFTRTAELIHLLERVSHDAECRFSFFTRNFDNWLLSAYNQEVKQVRCRFGFDEWSRLQNFDHGWDVNIALIREATTAPIRFDAIEDDAQSDPFPGAGLLRYAGVPSDVVSAMELPERENESLSPGALDFMLQANRSDLSLESLRTVRALVIGQQDVFR